jgi:hypothetical protein
MIREFVSQTCQPSALKDMKSKFFEHFQWPTPEPSTLVCTYSSPCRDGKWHSCVCKLGCSYFVASPRLPQNFKWHHIFVCSLIYGIGSTLFRPSATICLHYFTIHVSLLSVAAATLVEETVRPDLWTGIPPQNDCSESGGALERWQVH